MIRNLQSKVNTNLNLHLFQNLPSLNPNPSFTPCYLKTKKIDYNEINITNFDIKCKYREYNLLPNDEVLLKRQGYSFKLQDKEIGLDNFGKELVLSEEKTSQEDPK